MAHYLDLESWPRREVFEFFRGFDKPFFNICVRLDITELIALLKLRNSPHIALAYHYFALRVANELESFHYRLRDGRVFVLDVIHGGTTVLLPNETFTLAYFDYSDDFDTFIDEAARSVDAVRSGDGAFRPRNEDDGRIHFTALPWMAFTSFSHARNWKNDDSIPKMAFGKFAVENGRTMMPFSVEVHHALMDGLHVGRYLSRFDEVLRKPEIYISK